MPTIAQEYLAIDPEVRFGKPRIAGRRITVSDIVVWHCQLGEPLTQIAEDYELSLASIHAALAYFYDHRAEIDEELARQAAFYEEAKRTNRSILQEKLAAIGRA